VDTRLATRHVPVMDFTHRYPCAWVFLPPLVQNILKKINSYLTIFWVKKRVCLEMIILFFTVILLKKKSTSTFYLQIHFLNIYLIFIMMN